MIGILVSLLSFHSAMAAPQPSLKCRAIYRTIGEDGKEIQKIAEMPVNLAIGTVVKYGADLEGKFFSVTEEQNDTSFLGQITAGPEYTKGSVSRGVPDAKGKFNLSEVDGVVVYRMECQKI